MTNASFSVSGRKYIVMAVLGLGLLFLFLGLVRLQVIQHSELREQSDSNRIRVVPIPARRGNVYDREGQVIIDNRPSYSVAVVLAEEEEDVTIPRLASLIDFDTSMVRQRIKKNLVSRYQPAVVKKDISFEVIAKLEEQNTEFPGVSYQMERVRQYPIDLGCEVFTGYVGEISREELTNDPNDDYRLGGMVGKKGIEKNYDDILRGREGTAYIEVSASGHIIGQYEGRPTIEPVPGVDLTLTIDLDLQQTCAAAIDTFNAAIVAIDPRTGEVLALTSHPGFNANIFSGVIPEDIWEDISTSVRHPLLNRPIVGLYPPGSTTKFITVGAGLMEGIITEQTTFSPCIGAYRYGNRTFHCWDLKGHGRLNAVTALERSCDIYMYQLGDRLGVDKLSEYFAQCGFGVPTGIDVPGEASGLNPNSTYYNERYGKNKWSKGLVLNNSIGQGEILVTPLQLAQFYCGLANDGVVYRPHLVSSKKYADGRLETISPEISFKLPFNPHTLEILYSGMRHVVEGEHGTARALRNKWYTIGGKTGTAQNPHGAEHAWFVGVAPLEKPEIVVCAILENAGHGSEAAAPVVAKVIARYMDLHYGIERLKHPTPADTVKTAQPVETAEVIP
jgi:penicillin-binding protein 2